jgi:excisionase family DNA binding protein
MEPTKKTSTIKNLLTPTETADFLGVTVGTLQIWRTTRRYPLPYVKSGRLVRYKVEDVLAFIERRTVSFGENEI